jgi:hypothetical protein
MKKVLVMMVLAAVAGSASAQYVELVPTTTYTNTLSGSVLEIAYSNTPNRGVIISGNTDDWSGGLPTNGNPGLVVGGTYDFVNNENGGMYGIWVRQTGGQLTDAFLPMRGGAAGTTDGNIIEIDDASNDGSYTNLAIEGQLTMWNSNGGDGGTGNELSVLNGYATVGELNTTGNPAVNAKFNILNGRLDVGSLLVNKASCTVTMLAGGTGEVNLDDMTTAATMDKMVLNFESGSEASFTIASNGGANAQGTWETKIAAGGVRIDGSVVTDEGQFTIENVGANGAKISLNPYRINLKFIGQNNDPDAPVGAVSVAANWSGGTLPSGGWIGEIYATSNVWPGAAWSNLNVRQTGGIIQGTDLELSAGSLYTIDDPRTHYATYTNLYLSGELDVGAELNLLSGHIEAGTLNLSASNTINIYQGSFHIASISNASGTVNFMASGGGALTTDSFDADPGSFTLNFERGTRGSFTGLDSAIWTSMITNGQVSIDGVVSTDLALFSVSSTLSLVPAAPWWDDFPRMVSSANSVAAVTNLNGSFGMNGNAQDPSWGTFFQAYSISTKTGSIAEFQNAGMKQIGYFETYGQSYSLVAELAPEPWDQTNLTEVLHSHWGWQSYDGGIIRWLGANNFFDDQEFARPYTRTHPRYGGPAMTYPDGSAATGYNGPDTDPRNSEVYDAAVSKDVLGNIYIDTKDAPPVGSPTNGLVYLPELDKHIGLFMFKKDAACLLWDDYTYASTLQAADAGIDGMWTDNYGPWDSVSSSPVKAAFGDWSVARFRDHLTNSFSSAELLAMGVTNAAAFDVREHMKDVATGWGWDGSNLNSSVWNDSGWMGDALWRAYLIFKRQTGTEALSNYYSTVKAAALEGGKPEFLVAGNDIPGFSHGWCRGDLDMVSTEMSMGWKLSGGSDGFMAPPVGRYSPFYKVAREHAKSRFVNVWLYNDHYVDEFANPELCNVMYYEMLATHTFPKFDSSNPRIAGDDETNGDFFEFVGQAAEIYGDRVPAEDIGLYYSSSSIVRQMTPRGYAAFNAQPHQFSFWGWGSALTELHMQYRAVPEWKLTAETLAGLKLLILPNADVFATNDVTEVLTPWLNSGGRLVIAGDCGIYHGESGNFASNTTGLAVASITNHANVTVRSGNIGMDYFLDYENRDPASLSYFTDAIDTALTGTAPSGITATTASDRTGLTIYKDEAAGRLFVDVNNVDITTNYVMTGTGAIEIETVLPDWLTNQRLQLSVVTPQTNMPSIELLSVLNDTIRVELGSVEYYAGVVVEKDAEWAAWQDDNFTPQEIAAGLANLDQDPDGDGFTNEQEQLVGTDPRDPSSVFEVRLGSGNDLLFDGLTGRIYSTWFRTNLLLGSWEPLRTNLPGTGFEIVVDDTNDWATVFYRIEAERP